MPDAPSICRMKDASFINRGLNEADKVDWKGTIPPETQKLLKDLNAVLDAQREHIKENEDLKIKFKLN